MRLKQLFDDPRKCFVFPEDCDLPLLNEATRATVGRYTARRDPPHFAGDEYHGHADVPGGYHVSWGRSGARRHEGKFPAQVPRNARLAVAQVLGVSPSLLEFHRWRDPVLAEDVYLVTLLGAEPPH